MAAFAEKTGMPRPESTHVSPSPGVGAVVPGVRRVQLAVPRRGHVLTTVSEEYRRPVRAAVAVLEDALVDEECARVRHSRLCRRSPEPGAWVARSHAELLGWTLVSAWLTGYATGRIARGAGIEEGALWFFDGAPDVDPARLVPRGACARADALLAECADARGYLELLPYVLDPHGPGSRLSVRRDAGTRAVRDRKRAEGVYYTPADVADFMVRECLGGFPEQEGPPAILDPACGTAVFLRAALAALRSRWPDRDARWLAEHRLYGTDIDPWALDAAAFVVLADCLTDGGSDDALPLPMWNRLRLNLACVDALRLDPPDRELSDETKSKVGLAGTLVSRLSAADDESVLDERVSLSRLFPNLTTTGLVVVGNPPYSSVGERRDFRTLKRTFSSLGAKGGAASEIYPLFVEQMVRLAVGEQAAGTLVLPMSLASNVGNQFVNTRSMIGETPGRWRFAFFDREPHALFGEDVKTRNSIVFWRRERKRGGTEIESGPLRKWRGDNRAAMFASIRFTPVTGPIRSGIPKVDGACQARAYELLSARWERLDHPCSNIRRLPLAGVLTHTDGGVFVGATAYNFLNVFMKPPSGVLDAASVLSEHPLYAMQFRNREDAAATFALLSSHLAYWWWRSTQDGFHVTRRFLAALPFGVDALSGAARTALAACGDRLWSLMRTAPIISLNRGRSSLAYSPNGFDEERTAIDRILADLAGLDPVFVVELRRVTDYAIRAELPAVVNT